MSNNNLDNFPSWPRLFYWRFRGSPISTIFLGNTNISTIFLGTSSQGTRGGGPPPPGAGGGGCNWNGIAPFSHPCDGSRINVQFQQNDYVWTYNWVLACKNEYPPLNDGHIITGMVMCNPDVILTEFNESTCLSKWTPSISSSCGTATLTGRNTGDCTNDKPPLFYYNMDFTGCPDPQKCCPTCCRFEGYNIQDFKGTNGSKEECDAQTYDWGNGYIEQNGNWIPRSECNNHSPGVCQELSDQGYYTSGGAKFCFSFNDINNTRQTLGFAQGGGFYGSARDGGYISLQQQCGRWRLDINYPTYGGNYAVTHQFLDHEGACLPILPGVWQITEGTCL